MSKHEREWRRFELRFAEDSREKDELYALLDRLNLSRRELALLVSGIGIRPGFELRDFDTEFPTGQTVWAYPDGEKLVDVVQAALGNT